MCSPGGPDAPFESWTVRRTRYSAHENTLTDSTQDSSLTVDSKGNKVITGEAVTLRATAQDRCGNATTVTYDPAAEPSPLCDEVLNTGPDAGTCCPAVRQPAGGPCRLTRCGATSSGGRQRGLSRRERM